MPKTHRINIKKKKTEVEDHPQWLGAESQRVIPENLGVYPRMSDSGLSDHPSKKGGFLQESMRGTFMV